MKVVTFERNGSASYGVLDGSRVTDVGSRLASRYPDLKAVIAAGALQELQSAITSQSPSFGVEDVTLLPVIPNPNKILCVGHNYEEHRRETGRAKTDHPSLFV